jgi:hypothetical protein
MFKNELIRLMNCFAKTHDIRPFTLKRWADLWSVRATLNYRALAAEAHDGYLWFWLGTHEEYDKLLS